MEHILEARFAWLALGNRLESVGDENPYLVSYLHVVDTLHSPASSAPSIFRLRTTKSYICLDSAIRVICKLCLLEKVRFTETSFRLIAILVCIKPGRSRSTQFLQIMKFAALSPLLALVSTAGGVVLSIDPPRPTATNSSLTPRHNSVLLYLAVDFKLTRTA